MEKKRRVGAMLHRISLLMAYHLRAEGQKLIPPAQMRMLEFIAKNEGCSQAEVAAEMQVSPASVAQSIKRMEASGFITRVAREGDMRANSLRVTEGGADAAAQCRAVFDELEVSMANGFSKEEREKLSEYLARIIDNLESSDTGGMNNMELSKLVDHEGKKR